MKSFAIAAALTLTAGAALADDHMAPMVEAMDQSVSNGIVSAEKVMAESNGWLVVHRTDAEMKPGPVVGHAPLRAGETWMWPPSSPKRSPRATMLMLMVHGEEGGMETGIFEYTLGAKEDGPIRVDGNLVMTTITVE